MFIFRGRVIPPDKTQLRQGVDSTPTRGRFNSDKTRISPDRYNAELLWAPARFLLSSASTSEKMNLLEKRCRITLDYLSSIFG